MAEFTLRPKARTDLAGIWEYTVRKWGRDQAQRYLRSLNRSFRALAKRPRQGRLYYEVYEGLRVYPSGKHLIFYFSTDVSIDIVRVLHERMDIPQHLS